MCLFYCACVVVAISNTARPPFASISKSHVFVGSSDILVFNIGWEIPRTYRVTTWLNDGVDGGAGEALELGGVSKSHQSGDSNLDHLFENVLFSVKLRVSSLFL